MNLSKLQMIITPLLALVLIIVGIIELIKNKKSTETIIILPGFAHDYTVRYTYLFAIVYPHKARRNLPGPLNSDDT